MESIFTYQTNTKRTKKLFKFLQDNNLIQDFIMDPAGYIYQDDMCKALIIESSVPEGTTLFAAGEEEVIKSALSGISEAQCLLEVKFGETKKESAGIHISEREAWDNFIPKHPLSQLRKMISFIIDNN